MSKKAEDFLSQYGQIEPLVATQDEYKATTVEYMVNEVVIPNIEKTISALVNFDADKKDENGKRVHLKSGMAKSVRNGYAVKVGYGEKNEGLFDFGVRLVRKDGKVVPNDKQQKMKSKLFAEKDDAIDFLNNLVNEKWLLEEKCEVLLNSYRIRAAKGKEARTNSAAA